MASGYNSGTKTTLKNIDEERGAQERKKKKNKTLRGQSSEHTGFSPHQLF